MKEFSLMISHLRRYRWRLLLGFLSLAAVDGAQLIVPLVLRNAVDLLSSAQAAGNILALHGLAIIGLAIGIGLTRFGWRYPIIGASRKVERSMRDEFYRHLQTLSAPYFDRNKTGDLMALATNDLESVRMVIGIGMVMGVDALFLIVASVGLMLSLNASLTLVVLLPLPLLSLIMTRLGRRIHDRYRAVQESFGALTDKSREAYSGIEVIKSYVQEEAESESFEAINRDYFSKSMREIRMWGLVHVLISLISGVCMCLILFIGGHKVILGNMSMGSFVAFNSYLGLLLWPMMAIGWVINIYQRGRASMGRLQKVMSLLPEIADPPNPVEPTEPWRGQLEVRNLSFAYGDGPLILEDINLRAEPGELIAIVGRTGCGKSTLLRLLSRLYEVPAGTIFLDSLDIRTLRLSDLRSTVATVPQESFLFSDTIYENIRLGHPDASDSDAERVADLAEVGSDIREFPGGFNTVVGERGVTLSGGQRQRVALARALLMPSPFLVLDDAFSAVDTETEARIVAHLRDLQGNRTVLLVSHRISTVKRADRIYVMDRGKIVEQGTHDELIALGGMYADLDERQRLMEELETGFAPASTAGTDV